MITLKNTDTQVLYWYLMEKYDFDINNALASGTLNGGQSTSLSSPTGSTVSVVWAFDGSKMAAAGIVGNPGTSEFYNDPNGAWSKQF